MLFVNIVLSFLTMACTAFAQMVPFTPGCALSSPSVKTLTFTPWMAPQIAPTSTVYQIIVTHYDYVGIFPSSRPFLCLHSLQVVYCSNGAATVTNVQANPPAIVSARDATSVMK